MKLINENHANKVTITSFGELHFDEKGVLVKPELKEEELKALAELAGYVLEGSQKAQEPKEVDKKLEVKEEEKESENEAEEPKTRQPRGRNAKK